jgi:hypothetical protein
MKAWLAALLLVAACANEEYTPLIHVTPGAAARIDYLHRDKTQKPAAGNPARVHALRAGEELVGPGATGRTGDIVLENDEVAFVVSLGNIVDAADAKTRIDELGEVATYFGSPGHKAVYTSHTTGVLEDGTAFDEEHGYDHDETAVVVRTRYTLHKNDRAVLVETTLENTTNHAVALASLGDSIKWGAKRVVSTSAFVGAVGDKTSYALTSAEGAVELDAGGNTMQQRRVEIPPGKSVGYVRIFLVGPRADSSGLIAELTKAAGGEVGSVTVRLVAEGTPVTVADAVVEIDDTSGHPIMDLAGDSAGGIAGEVPPGKYAMRFLRGGGRTAHGDAKPVEIAANRDAAVVLEVTAAR